MHRIELRDALKWVFVPILFLYAVPTSGDKTPDEPPFGTPRPNAAPSASAIAESLGDEHYRIGDIRLDKRHARFTVTGTVLRREPPLEFLAVSRNGAKAYESLLELNTTAKEFNLACVLIGLDVARSRPPTRHFDAEPVTGDRVDIRVSWTANGRTIAIDPADLIRLGDKTLARGEWTYAGSGFTPDGRYLADLDGTLIGFVHAPATIIEHRTGLLDSFGDVTPNVDLLPPVGSRMELTVTRTTTPETPSPQPR